MKKLILIFCLLSLFCKSQNGFGKHYIAGAIISGGSATGIYAITNKPLFSSFIGALIGGSVGLLKEEVYDRAWHNGTPNDEDKIATFAGSFFIMLPFCFVTNEYKKSKIDKEYYTFK